MIKTSPYCVKAGETNNLINLFWYAILRYFPDTTKHFQENDVLILPSNKFIIINAK